MEDSQITELEKKLARLQNEYAEFSYIVSHDLSAPMRGIQMIVQWLQQDHAPQFDSDGIELLKLLSKQVQRMQRMLEMVLEFSRIGRLYTETTQVNTQDLVHAIISTLPGAGSITWHVDTSLPVISANAKRIEQLFRYLFENSIQAIAISGEIFVSCSEKNSVWQFEIRDNGQGIPISLHALVFNFFYTTDMDRESGKLGCGLSFAKKIVETHGGEMWLNSQPGCGTTISFTMPKDTKDSQHG